MNIAVEKRLPAGPAVVWPFLTDPDLMRRWSRARVELVSPGDGGRPDGVGAVRTVAISTLAGTVRLREVIQAADPPHTLIYRVFDSPGIQRHCGRISLLCEGEQSHLTWEVKAELGMPGLAGFAKRILEPQLRASLDALAEQVRGATAAALAEPPQFPPEDIEPLLAEARHILDLQRQLADELEAAGDPKRWFSRVYQYVTEEQLAACSSSTHPGWILRLIPRFHHYYASNLDGWRQGQLWQVESHWRRAFATMEQGPPGRSDPAAKLFAGLWMGIRAHIEEDLPRTLAEVYASHYASTCSYARFRSDYILMGDIFRRASDRLSADIPNQLIPYYARLLRAMLPAELSAILQHRRFYDVPRKRMQAFARGERIATLLLAHSRPQTA